MTIAILVVAWVAVAILIGRRDAIAATSARAQAVAALASLAALALIPISAAVVTLSRALDAFGGSGLAQCGQLVVAIVAQPLGRPELTVALLVVAAIPSALAFGGVAAWRSQRKASELVRHSGSERVVVPVAELIACTVGVLRPRVVVSEGLLASAPADYVRVVLAHEDAHRRGRHPLLLLIGESVARGLPAPPLRWAANALRFALESRADDKAAEVTSRALVAETVATFALARGAAGIGFEGDAVRRARRLLAPPSHGRAARAAMLLPAAGLLTTLGYAGAHAAHCAHAAAAVLGVVQCRFG